MAMHTGNSARQLYKSRNIYICIAFSEKEISTIRIGPNGFLLDTDRYMMKYSFPLEQI